jgi:hypothetical protein
MRGFNAAGKGEHKDLLRFVNRNEDHGRARWITAGGPLRNRITKASESFSNFVVLFCVSYSL